MKFITQSLPKAPAQIVEQLKSGLQSVGNQLSKNGGFNLVTAIGVGALTALSQGNAIMGAAVGIAIGCGSEYCRLTGRVTALEASGLKDRKNSASVTAELKELKSDGFVDGLKKQLSEKESALETLKKSNESLTQVVTKDTTELSQLQCELAHTKASLSKLEKSTDPELITKLKEQIKDLESQVSQLTAKSKVAESSYKQLVQSTDQKLAQLQAKLATQISLVEDLSDQEIEDQSGLVETLTKEIESLQEFKTSESTQFDVDRLELDEEIAALKHELLELKKTSSEMISGLTKELSSRSEIICDGLTKIAAKELEISELKDQALADSSALDDSLSVSGLLEAQLAVLNQSKEKAELGFKHLLASVTTEKDILSDGYTKVLKEAESLQSDVNRLQAETIDLQAKVRSGIAISNLQASAIRQKNETISQQEDDLLSLARAVQTLDRIKSRLTEEVIAGNEYEKTMKTDILPKFNKKIQETQSNLDQENKEHELRVKSFRIQFMSKIAELSHLHEYVIPNLEGTIADLKERLSKIKPKSEIPKPNKDIVRAAIEAQKKKQ